MFCSRFSFLSPKVTNNIAQGKAVSATTLGDGNQKLRSLKGSNICLKPAITFRSILWREMFFRIFVGQGKIDRNYMNSNKLSFLSTPGQRWDKRGTRSRFETHRAVNQPSDAQLVRLF